MQEEPTVFVVDDDEQARRSVCALVRSMGLKAEEFPSADDFLANYVPGQPGCLVTDVRLIGMSGIELQERLSELGILLPVVVITAYARTPLTVRAVKAGAVNVLEKPYVEDELWDAIRQALVEDAAKRVEHEHREQLRRRAEQLTATERQVMKMIVVGLPNKVIANRLDISLRTVENRRRGVFEKMQAQSVAELVRMSIEANLDV
jgi:FixJ family two-component response regulator